MGDEPGLLRSLRRAEAEDAAQRVVGRDWPRRRRCGVQATDGRVDKAVDVSEDQLRAAAYGQGDLQLHHEVRSRACSRCQKMLQVAVCFSVCVACSTDCSDLSRGLRRLKYTTVYSFAFKK